MEHFCQKVLALATAQQSAYICFATAHMIVEATRDAAVHSAYRNASVISPDGVPVAWFTRLLGNPDAECVSGPRSFPILLEEAARRGIPVGFYGGRQNTLDLIEDRIAHTIPELRVAYSFSPPFRQLTVAEQNQHLRDIQASGARLLFVGLGSPRQECWMDEFSSHLDCVCLGVGGAFEFFAGEKVLPPLWIQQLGLTWLVRLCQEPRRLIQRNLYSPYFLLLATRWLVMNPSQRQQWQNRIEYGMQCPPDFPQQVPQ